MSEDVKNMDDYQELLRTVFSNDKGRKLLGVWDVNFRSRISFYPGNTSEETAFREGERSFVQQIVDLVGE